MTRCAEPVLPIEELAELSNRQREKSEPTRLWRIREKELLGAREAHFIARDESELLIKRATFVRSVKYEMVEPLILRPSDDLFDEEAADSVSSPLRFGENVHNCSLIKLRVSVAKLPSAVVSAVFSGSVCCPRTVR
jgi:hypothetical protein